jgi:hypothetical protein
MTTSYFRRPSAWVPIAMSVSALALVAAHLVFSGATREGDEGTAARLWQLLLAGQVPIIGWFLLRWLPKGGRQALAVLAVQTVAACAAIVPVALLGL